MGITDLWPLLDSSSKKISLAALSLPEFSKSYRGYRLGIDVSIWFCHAKYGKKGKNLQLRTLFYRCAILLKYPILPIFIFDGPKRPDRKRGRKIDKTRHPLTEEMKVMVEAFGFEWRMAPGEAEAELAYLNAAGIIDGILSDDGNSFVFGAHTLLRKPPSKEANIWTYVHVRTDIESSRADLILIALCSGGDYCKTGLPGCGAKMAYALARAGLSTSLYKAATTLPRSELPAFLTTWCTELKEELRTDSHRCIGRKMVSLAKSVPESFPNIDVLLAYTHPVTSLSEGKPDYYADIWTRKEPQIPALAGFCDYNFGWGCVKRFRTLIWPGIALRALRRDILDDDPEKPVPGDGWMKKIHSQREHHSTDETLEYRVEVDPTALVALAEAGVKCVRRSDDEEWEVSDDEQDDKDSKKKGSVDPLKPLRLWLPAALVRQAKPELVEAYEEVLRKKQERTVPKGIKRKKGEELGGDEKSKPKPRKKKKKDEEKDSTSQGQDIRLFFPSHRKSSTTTALKDLPIANASSSTVTPSVLSTSTKATHSRHPRPFPASLGGGPKPRQRFRNRR